MFAIQDIVFRTRPEFIVELGVAWGGALLFFATLMEVLGGERVIGIDVFLPEDLRKRLAAHGRVSERITLLQGSSTDDTTLAQVRALVGAS